jgi:hypothetical protein
MAGFPFIYFYPLTPLHIVNLNLLLNKPFLVQPILEEILMEHTWDPNAFTQVNIQAFGAAARQTLHGETLFVIERDTDWRLLYPLLRPLNMKPLPNFVLAAGDEKANIVVASCLDRLSKIHQAILSDVTDGEVRIIILFVSDTQLQVSCSSLVLNGLTMT